jgi:cyclopropane-fatty-acyl-phospholipid synthase
VPMWIIEQFLRRLIRKGQLRLIAEGKITDLGSGESGPRVCLRFHDRSLLLKLVLDFPLHFGEAYMDGRLTIEQGTLYDALELFAMNYNDAPLMIWDFLSERFEPVERTFRKQNNLSDSRKNVAHHYDFSADFFKLFLDQDLNYSCAYFTTAEADLDEAQADKKRLIAAKLLLQKGMRVLDIGSGFGGLAIYLAQNYRVEVTGITLSQEQLKVACERAKAAGLEELVKFELKDYRQVSGSFDRVVSVGMFEHVGVVNYREFFARLRALLKDDGVALLHSIGRNGPPGTIDNWIDKYIFPGGYAPALSEVWPAIEKNNLWVCDMEILQSHYARTLSCWRANFERNREAIKAIYDERFCRMWEFYLIGAEMEFLYGPLMVFHLQLARDRNVVPATRNYMLAESVITESTAADRGRRKDVAKLAK